MFLIDCGDDYSDNYSVDYDGDDCSNYGDGNNDGLDNCYGDGGVKQ